MFSEAEWLTRKHRIDTTLRGLNPPWKIVPWQEGLDTSKLACPAVTEFPTENGPADYALFVDGRLLGIIEAKKVAVNLQNVLEQAKRYSRGAANGHGKWNGFRVPFLCASTLAAKHKFTAEQMQWLSLVREQLIKNLAIDEDDYDNTPLLQGRGGAAKAKRVFGKPNLLVAQLNEAVAA